MSSSVADIILPVWNRPGETRECLAALVKHSADARLILMDLCSESETEQLLHEFAEYLGERAVLVRSERMRGLIDTINKGLSMASAPLMVVLRSSCRVAPGWLEPLLETSRGQRAGVLVPSLAPLAGDVTGQQVSGYTCREARRGNFIAMGITRSLYEGIGGFDNGLDGDVWCLADYSRRAERAGFRTLRVDGPPVLYREEPVYGAIERRKRIIRESESLFRARWGEDYVYCLSISPKAQEGALTRLFEVILAGARRGNRFFVLTPFGVYRRLAGRGLHRLHENIEVEWLSCLFPSRSMRAALRRCRDRCQDMKLLNGLDGLLDLDGDQAQSVSFAEMENLFTTAEV